LNRNAANAFLKTLEEPPAGTHILLVSHRPASLPATIRSRCQLQRLALPGSEESLAWLQAEVGSEREARELLALAAGRPLQALALRDDPTAAVLRRVPVAVQALLAGEGDIPGFIALTDDLPLEEVLQQLWYHIHGAVCQALVQGEPGGHSRHMLRLAQRIQALQRNLHSGANPNRQVQLEALLVALRRDMAQAARG